MPTTAEYRTEMVRRGPGKPIFVQGTPDVAAAKRLAKAEPEAFAFDETTPENPTNARKHGYLRMVETAAAKEEARLVAIPDDSEQERRGIARLKGRI